MTYKTGFEQNIYFLISISNCLFLFLFTLSKKKLKQPHRNLHNLKMSLILRDILLIPLKKVETTI